MTQRRILTGVLVLALSAALMLSAVSRQVAAAEEEVARPSNAGGPGAAATMQGGAAVGAKLFAANCMPCHGAEGKGGIPNPGSTDGSVPPLNPIDPTMVSKDPKVFAYNIDLFIQNGSTPEGHNPAIKMPPWGADKMLTQEQIADLIAYLMSLNPAQ